MKNNLVETKHLYEYEAPLLKRSVNFVLPSFFPTHFDSAGLKVHVDYLRQKEGHDYSLSGNTIVFVAAPPRRSMIYLELSTKKYKK